MGLCSLTGGYENPAVASWTMAIAMQATVSLVLLLLGQTGGLVGGISDAFDSSTYGSIKFVCRGFFIGLGATHAVLFILTAAFVIAGYFMFPVVLCFLCPLTLINQLVLLTTSSFGGYMLSSSYRYAIDTNWAKEGASMQVADFSVHFVDSNTGLILLFTVTSLVCLLPYARSASISEKGTMADVMLYLQLVCGFIAAGGIFVFSTQELTYSILGAIWLGGGLIAAILISAQKNWCTNIMNVLLAIFFILGGLYAVVCMFICADYYIEGRKQAIRVRRTPALNVPDLIHKVMTVEEFNAYRNFVLTNNGTFNMAIVVVCSWILAFAVMSSFFSFRAICGGKSAVVRQNSNESDASEAA